MTVVPFAARGNASEVRKRKKENIAKSRNNTSVKGQIEAFRPQGVGFPVRKEPNMIAHLDPA